MALYDQHFYEDVQCGSERSAEIVLNRLFEMVGRPASLVDFGCGNGTWLSVASRLGVTDTRGYEGAWIAQASKFVDVIMIADVGTSIECERKFDLAMCLEVAEHLPKSSAEVLIQNLCSASDLVLFSAAIPHQGGTGHINEQWPSYWGRLFATCGFQCIDLIRPLLWTDSRVEPWYRQNILLFVRKATRLDLPRTSAQLDLVHPEMLEQLVAQAGAERNRLLPPRLRRFIGHHVPGARSVWRLITGSNR